MKAIYQRYMGWYDGNPSHLWQHTPVEAGKRYVEFMGGADAVVEKARGSFEAGDLRWAAQVLDHVVFAEPDHDGGEGAARRRARAARLRQRERHVARRVPLRARWSCAARRSAPPRARPPPTSSRSSRPELFFDAVAVQVDGPKAWDLDLATRWVFPDADGATYRVTLKNGVLSHVRDGKGDVTLTITVPKAALGPLAIGDVEAAMGAGLQLDGDASVLQSVLGVLDPGDPDFNIVTP